MSEALSSAAFGRRRRLIWVRFLLVCLIVLRPALAEEVRFATMRLGTSWYVFGATLYKLMRSELPQGDRMEIVAKGGGIGNPILIERGDVQIALSTRATAAWAWEGNPLVYDGVKHRKLRALVGGLNPVWISVLARESFLKDTGQTDLAAILTGNHPVRIVMKPRGSSVPVVADLIFDSLGTSRQKIRDRGGAIIQVDAQQIPTVLRNGRADIYLESTPRGHPTVTEVTLTIPMRFLDLPERVLDKLIAAGLQRAEVPAMFKGQNRPIQGVDLGTVIIASSDLSEELAYRITKTVCENKEALAKAHKAWSRFQPESAWTPENNGIPLHPGAARYYRERGWMAAEPRLPGLPNTLERAP